jgi:DNA-binding LacI/PurR family transcriptional regulator
LDSASYAVTRRRLAGYRAAAERYGLEWVHVPVWQGTDCTPEEGAAGAAAVLATTPRPGGLLCLSDRLAKGAEESAARMGLHVPDDLSLVGFDDAQPEAATLNLTTIDQRSRAKGEYAARALLDPIRRVPLMEGVNQCPTAGNSLANAQQESAAW